MKFAAKWFRNANGSGSGKGRGKAVQKSNPDKREFDGKVVFLTGAASGLGRAAALAFAREGATLALLDINAEGLKRTAGLIDELGGKNLQIAADISDPKICADVIAQSAAAFGQLDALCNVAGIVQAKTLPGVTASDWDRIFNINVRGPFFLIQAAMPHLLQVNGAVVNVASSSAFSGHPYLAVYAASKAAMVSMTKSLAMEYINKSVRINALAPGAMATEMGETMQFPPDMDMELFKRNMALRGASPPEDLTDMLLYLASGRAKSVHGACFSVDLGMTAG